MKKEIEIGSYVKQLQASWARRRPLDFRGPPEASHASTWLRNNAVFRDLLHDTTISIIDATVSTRLTVWGLTKLSCKPMCAHILDGVVKI